MLDINTIISQALAAAVAQATAPLLERIAALESQSAALLNRVTAANAVADRLHERVLALEATSIQGIGVLLENLDNQEWFWHKIREFTGTVVEQAVEQHCEEYDHNAFVTEDKLDEYVTEDKLDEYVTEDKLDEYVTGEALDTEVRDAVRDIMEGATVSIRI